MGFMPPCPARESERPWGVTLSGAAQVRVHREAARPLAIHERAEDKVAQQDEPVP
jgi:hypothetical protein